jgi:hypothetical protein
MDEEDAMAGQQTCVVHVVAASALVLGVVFFDAPAAAQNFGTPGRAFRIEAAPGTFARAPVVEGYVYNDGLYDLTNIRLRVEVLGSDGKAVAETSGWMFGDLASTSRGYFVLRVPRAGATYRVSVTSFDVISGGP